MKNGHQAEAHAAFADVLDTPLEVIDDQGIPIAFYAAGSLATSATAPVRDRILSARPGDVVGPITADGAVRR